MKERTKRRLLQLRESGTMTDAGKVEQDITSRDKIDSSREDSPLTCPHGAKVIDTSDKTMLEVVDVMEQVVREHLSADDSA